MTLFLAIAAVAVAFVLGWKAGASHERWMSAHMSAISQLFSEADEAARAYIDRGPLGTHDSPTLH